MEDLGSSSGRNRVVGHFPEKCSAQPAWATWVEYEVAMVESCARECHRDSGRGAEIKCVRFGDRAAMPAIDDAWR